MSTRGPKSRVEAAIREMEASHEILIGWIQLSLISFLGLLYWISPKGFNGQVDIEPVPLVLSLYLPLIFVRLNRAYRRALTPAWLFASVIADTSLVTFLIWCFHVQYRQPAAFSLKAPTFAYYFLFLSLRCLRYEAKYVIASGITAMLSWAALLSLALLGGNPTTHQFTEYMLGNYVLIGAEIDRILMLGLVTGVLAYGVSRSRALLDRSVEETQRRSQLTRFFSPKMADAILDSAIPMEPGKGIISEATVLSIDMRGFSRMSTELSPNEILGILGEYHDRMVTAIFAHQGCVDKYMGDGILAHYGVAPSTTTAAADALRSVEAMLASAQQWNEERRAAGQPALQFGFSCASGQLVFGAIGNPEKIELTIIGEVVNAAAKIEKHTKRAGHAALTTKETFDQAIAQGYVPTVPYEVLPAQAVDGLPKAVDLVALGDASISLRMRAAS